MGLNDSLYVIVHSSIIQQESFPTAKSVFVKICKEEYKNLSRIAGVGDSGTHGGIASAASKIIPKSSSSYRPMCTYYLKRGYEISSCYHLVGFPE